MTPKQIVKLRKDLDVTQEQLAEIIGAFRETVARWETGQNKPRGANLKALKELEAKARLNMKVKSVPVDEKTREEFKKKGRELGRCLVCKEPWGKRSSAELLKRHEQCFQMWTEKWSKRPG